MAKNNELICPVCGEKYTNKDYCDQDGAKLVPQTKSVQENDEEKSSKLAQLMKKVGLRRNTDQDQEILPEKLIKKGWSTEKASISYDGIDTWQISQQIDATPTQMGLFHRFRTGSLTATRLYERLTSQPTGQLTQVIDSGTMNVGGVRFDYELVSAPPSGKYLNEWFQEAPPSEERALHLLALLSELIQSLEQENIRPLLLEPGFLLISEDTDLWLTTASSVVEKSSAETYRPEFDRSPLLSKSWTAPELTQQCLSSDNALVFSIGQLLSQAVWGKERSIDEVQRGAVPFNSLSNACLAKVLMGCLWPHFKQRWTVQQLLDAITCENAEDMPPVPPWESLDPGAAGVSFPFAGKSFYRLEDLLATANHPEHWDEAIAQLEAILQWSKNTAWAGLAALMRQQLNVGKSKDWILVKMTRTVLPESPLTWRGLDFSEHEAENSLIGLGQRALQGSGKDVELINLLFKADLRGAFQAQDIPDHNVVETAKQTIS